MATHHQQNSKAMIEAGWSGVIAWPTGVTKDGTNEQTTIVLAVTPKMYSALRALSDAALVDSPEDAALFLIREGLLRGGVR